MVLVFLDVAPATILARQATDRDRPLRHDVRDAVLREHLDGFEPPGDDEEPLRLPAEDLRPADVTDEVRRALATAT